MIDWCIEFNAERMETDADSNVPSDFYRSKELMSANNDEATESMETGESDEKCAEKEDAQEKQQKRDEDITDKESNDATSENKGKETSKSDESAKENQKNSSIVIKQFKDMYTECSRENIRLHQIITSLQEQQHSMSLKVRFWDNLISDRIKVALVVH